MNIAVDPTRRRRGIATALLEELIARAGTGRALHARGAPLEQSRDRTCTSAIGFRVAGTRRRYYQDNGEDALIMWRTPATLTAARLPDRASG